jgi:hypothetical protein
MSIIDRLLDEAEKAQRKGHLLLAEVCRDAADELGLVIEERNQLCMLWWAAMNHPGVTVECAGDEAADRFNALAAGMDRIPLHTQGDGT